MRYVSIDYVTEGMVLGKPFYGRSGQLMLNEGVALTRGFIRKIRELQYSGLYILDAFSEGIEIKDVISTEVRHNITGAMGRLLTNVQKGNSQSFAQDMQKISQYLNNLIDEIMASSSTVVNIIDLKEFDLYTHQHSVNVCVLSCIIGMVYSMPRPQLYTLAMAAILHDVGKMFIDKDLLNKPSQLTPDEFEIMRSHANLGYELTSKKSQLSSSVTTSILQHHERYNGEGYPLGRKGSEIPINAQIISIVDVYDALTSKRPYHDPVLPSEAYEYISGNSGRAFNPELVDVFIKKIAPFPLGVQVQLSNGLTGIVFKNYEECLTRPLIKINPSSSAPEERFIDLAHDVSAYNITIEKVIA